MSMNTVLYRAAVPLLLTVMMAGGCAPEPTASTEQFAVPAAPVTAAVTTQAFPITDLGTLPGGLFSSATDINAASEVVGYSSYSGGGPHAFRWTTGGGMFDLGTLAGATNDISQANAINDAGEIVGWSASPLNIGSAAFFWSPASGMVMLPSEPSIDAVAYDINASHQIVGYGAVPGGTSEVLQWTPNGAGGWTVIGLGLPPGGIPGIAKALGVNATGGIVGESNAGGFILSGGAFRSLGSGTSARRIAAGRTVGAGSITGFATGQALEWPSLTGLPFPLGYLTVPYSVGLDVNGANHVVGVSGSPVLSGAFPDMGRAFYWDCAGGMVDMGSLGGSASDTASAFAINTADVAAGVSNNHAVIWGVIPSSLTVIPLPFQPGCVLPPNIRYKLKKFLNDGIVSRPGFDATQIDPNSVTVSDGFGHVTPIARTAAGGPMFQIIDLNGDGVPDLKVSFLQSQMIANGSLTRKSFQLVVSWTDPTGLPNSGKFPIRVQ